jgi:hypothetical protein
MIVIKHPLEIPEGFIDCVNLVYAGIPLKRAFLADEGFFNNEL